jgi:hypothetical protein
MYAAEKGTAFAFWHIDDYDVLDIELIATSIIDVASPDIYVCGMTGHCLKERGEAPDRIGRSSCKLHKLPSSAVSRVPHTRHYNFISQL